MVERFNEYNRAVSLLTSSGKFRIELGLERISAVLELLGNPQEKLKCIHVAGTNGKGSVCSMLASVLSESGLKVGLYTSPHIYEYTERIKINGCDIPREVFAKLVTEVTDNDIPLTEFEILTAMMFKYFADNGVDVVVLETGLGGRFDATNVIKSNLCAVITRIDYDHTERLGKTLDEITREKEGIIKPGCPVVRLETRDKRLETSNCSTNLKGVYQQENLALVLEVLEKVCPQIPQENIEAGLKKVVHPARFQVVNENLIVDACHNPNGAKALRQSLDEFHPERKRRFVFGCLENKDYENMACELFRPQDEIYYVDFKGSRKFDGQKFPSQKFQSLDKLPQDDTLVIVCGSIYMISEIIPANILLG